MTVIVGLVHGGVVLIGGDSAAVGGLDLTLRKDPKVFQNGQTLIGYTSSFRMGQLLRFKFSPPAHPEGMDPYEYMVALFVDAVRDTLKGGGYARKNAEEEEGGTFLVGYRGHLFEVQSDYQVGESHNGYAAVGCGDQVAHGVFYATAHGPLDPEERVRLALKAAERHSAGVRAPFTVLRLPEVFDTKDESGGVE